METPKHPQAISGGLIDEYAVIVAQIKHLEALRKTLQSAAMAELEALGGTASAGDYTVELKQGFRRPDEERLRKRYPKLADACAKTIVSMSLLRAAVAARYNAPEAEAWLDEYAPRGKSFLRVTQR